MPLLPRSASSSRSVSSSGLSLGRAMHCTWPGDAGGPRGGRCGGPCPSVAVWRLSVSPSDDPPSHAAHPVHMLPPPGGGGGGGGGRGREREREREIERVELDSACSITYTLTCTCTCTLTDNHNAQQLGHHMKPNCYCFEIIAMAMIGCVSVV